MTSFSYNLVIFMMRHTGCVPAALVVASLNMLVQVLFSLIFGADHVPKLRGDRG